MPAGPDPVRLVIEDGSPPVLTFAGALELQQSNRIRQLLDQAFTTESPDIYLDLQAVSRVDAHVVGLLTLTVKRQRDRGGRLVVLTISSVARRVFDLTGLSKILVMPADQHDES